MPLFFAFAAQINRLFISWLDWITQRVPNKSSVPCASAAAAHRPRFRLQPVRARPAIGTAPKAATEQIDMMAGGVRYVAVEEISIRTAGSINLCP
jgi:hypothetical protein